MEQLSAWPFGTIAQIRRVASMKMDSSRTEGGDFYFSSSGIRDVTAFFKTEGKSRMPGTTTATTIQAFDSRC
jgi:hypothetical protein